MSNFPDQMIFETSITGNEIKMTYNIIPILPLWRHGFCVYLLNLRPFSEFTSSQIRYKHGKRAQQIICHHYLVISIVSFYLIKDLIYSCVLFSCMISNFFLENDQMKTAFNSHIWKQFRTDVWQHHCPLSCLPINP